MQTNKKIVVLALLGTLVLPVMAFAAIDANPPTGQIGSLEDIVVNVENALWIIFGAVAVIMFVVAGILFLTAQGDPEKVQSARSALIWGVAGVAVGILAYSIIEVVLTVIV